MGREGFCAENESSVGAGVWEELANADSVGCANTYHGMGRSDLERNRIRFFSIATL
jgi:hypothetical protein